MGKPIITHDSLFALSYQLRGPRITTMGPCARGCGNSARGSGVCRHCLTTDLGKLIGISDARKVARSMRVAQIRFLDAEERISELMQGQDK